MKWTVITTVLILALHASTPWAKSIDSTTATSSSLENNDLTTSTSSSSSTEKQHQQIIDEEVIIIANLLNGNDNSTSDETTSSIEKKAIEMLLKYLEDRIRSDMTEAPENLVSLKQLLSRLKIAAGQGEDYSFEDVGENAKYLIDLLAKMYLAKLGIE